MGHFTATTGKILSAIHTEVPQVSGSVSSAAQLREAKLEKLKKEKIHFEL